MSRIVPVRSLLVLSLGASVPAAAVTYDGTPVLRWRVDRTAHDFVGGEVTLDKVRVHACGGGTTDVDVNDGAVDPVSGGEVAIPAGNHCQITFLWATDLEVDGASFTVRYEEASTAVPLAASIDPVALTPYDVVSGSYSGQAPHLVVDID